MMMMAATTPIIIIIIITDCHACRTFLRNLRKVEFTVTKITTKNALYVLFRFQLWVFTTIYFTQTTKQNNQVDEKKNVALSINRLEAWVLQTFKIHLKGLEKIYISVQGVAWALEHEIQPHIQSFSIVYQSQNSAKCLHAGILRSSRFSSEWNSWQNTSYIKI